MMTRMTRVLKRFAGLGIVVSALYFLKHRSNFKKQTSVSRITILAILASIVMTIHHWQDWRRGIRELLRVATSRVVVLTCDTDAAATFWLHDYFPEIATIDRMTMPHIGELRKELGDVTVRSLPIPHDCTDGFLGAYWRRPKAYLSPAVRRGHLPRATTTCSACQRCLRWCAACALKLDQTLQRTWLVNASRTTIRSNGRSFTALISFKTSSWEERKRASAEARLA
jgi:hypothetical protein